MSDDRIRDMDFDPETSAVDKKEVNIYFLKGVHRFDTQMTAKILYMHTLPYLYFCSNLIFHDGMRCPKSLFRMRDLGKSSIGRPPRQR